MNNPTGTLAPDRRGTPRPWYGHGWVWLLIAIPGASVVFGITMIVLAWNSPNDLVRDDYYKAGLAINRDLSAVKRAAALGIGVTLEDRGPGHLLLRVEAPGGTTPADADVRLSVELQHPTLEARDVRGYATAVAPGRWALTLPRFDGVRTLRVTHPDGWVVQQPVRAPHPVEDPS